MHLHMVEGAASDDAVCLDGSPGSFYLRANASSPEWVLYLQGGGWCYTPQMCLERSRTVIGSSSQLPPTAAWQGLINNDCEVNPRFCGVNQVRLNYCDGFSFAGDAEPLVVNGTTLHFRGRRVLRRIIATLVRDHGLGRARRVLVSGCSAGGLAAFMHADAIGEAIRAAGDRGAEAEVVVKAAPVSGFFLDADNVAGTPVYPREMRRAFAFQNATGGVHAGCVAAARAAGVDPERCAFAEYTLPHVRTPVFPMQSAYDEWQASNVMAVAPTLPPHPFSPRWARCQRKLADCSEAQVAVWSKYRALMVERLTALPTRPGGDGNRGGATLRRPGSGLFLHSCVGHCETELDEAFDALRVDGVTARQAVQAWFDADAAAPADQNTYLPCEMTPRPPFMCNPACARVCPVVNGGLCDK